MAWAPLLFQMWQLTPAQVRKRQQPTLDLRENGEQGSWGAARLGPSEPDPCCLNTPSSINAAWTEWERWTWHLSPLPPQPWTLVTKIIWGWGAPHQVKRNESSKSWEMKFIVRLWASVLGAEESWLFRTQKCLLSSWRLPLLMPAYQIAGERRERWKF